MKKIGEESLLPKERNTMATDIRGIHSIGVAWERRGKGGESCGRVKVAMFSGFQDQFTPTGIALEQSKNLHGAGN
jgi:hypothetical protein